MSDLASRPRVGMSRRTARAIEFLIVALSVASLVMLFQPFSLPLYSAGAGLVIIAGLLFNLVPFCTPGRTVGALFRTFLIIVFIFAVVTALALASAELYAAFLTG